MKGLSIVALAGLPVLFTASCVSPSHPVAEKTPGHPGPTLSSVHPNRVPAQKHVKAAARHISPPSASGCKDAPGHGKEPVDLEYTTVTVDWIDFVQLKRTQYVAGLDAKVPPVASTRLGAVMGRVRCQVSALKFSKSPPPGVDGDAGFLTIGTEIHAINGFAPSCRVAARVDGVNRVYLAHYEVGGYSKPVPCAKAP